jgi:hypothetical protein
MVLAIWFLISVETQECSKNGKDEAVKLLFVSLLHFIAMDVLFAEKLSVFDVFITCR